MPQKAPSFEGVFFVVFVRKKGVNFVTQKRMNEGLEKCENSLQICMNEAHEPARRKCMQEVVRFPVVSPFVHASFMRECMRLFMRFLLISAFYHWLT